MCLIRGYCPDPAKSHIYDISTFTFLKYKILNSKIHLAPRVAFS